jgi:hypothetical protein
MNVKKLFESTNTQAIQLKKDKLITVNVILTF